MKFLIFFAVLVGAPGLFAAELSRPGSAPRADHCQNVLTFPSASPLADLYAEIAGYRARARVDRDGGRDLDTFLHDAEALQIVAAPALLEIGRLLRTSEYDNLDVRTVFNRVLTARARRPAGRRCPAADPRSVWDLEEHHDPRRVNELTLIPDLVEEVRSGRKTSTIRDGNPWDLKSGPAVFKVPGTDVVIPVVIRSVKFRQHVFHLRADDLLAQGSFVRDAYAREGHVAALFAIADGMKRYYPRFTPEGDVTVVHFRLR